MLYWQTQRDVLQQKASSNFIRETLAPFIKYEAERQAAEHDAKFPSFQYVLCAATSPAVKLNDETLTYLNQGQSYEIRMLSRKLAECTHKSSKCVKSLVRVVFHDRRLQCTEHQQLEGWRWSRPGDRILDMDLALSVGVMKPGAHPLQLNTIEFLWDPVKSASVFIQVNCISTEFTTRKHGGEKGVPFRIQVDSFVANEQGEYLEHVHSSSCQIKVFKPKGADRKLKTDREKIEKKSLEEKEKYQPSYETTILTECCPWPEGPSVSSSRTSASPPALHQHSASVPPPAYHCDAPDHCSTPGNYSPNHQGEPLLPLCSDKLMPSFSSQETQEWLHRNRFSTFCRLFTCFSGADLLKMSRDDFIQICGPADGIRLFNAVKGRCILPRLTVYVSQQKDRIQLRSRPVYHALYLETLTLLELTEKLASLYGVSAQQICRVYRQGPTGIHILVSNEMVQNFTEETSFIISTLRDEKNDGFHVFLK